jgi:K+-transporting ATPase KdpF subunit
VPRHLQWCEAICGGRSCLRHPGKKKLQVKSHGRFDLGCGHDRVFRGLGRLCALLRPGEISGHTKQRSEPDLAAVIGEIMSLQSIVMLVISALVMAYLFYALLRPEKF